MPGISGKCGRLSCPTALTTALATSVSSVPSGVRTTTDHVAVVSSHVAERTSVRKRI